MREPVVAGKFYEAGFEELDKQIRECFEGTRGPGTLPSSPAKSISDVKGAIVPHAGYDFSGACAAWVYKEIAQSKTPDVFIILGPNHYGNGNAKISISSMDWKTPLGVAQTNKKFATALTKKIEIAAIEEEAFAREHCIEVQIPFLQFISAKKFSLNIVPIVLRDLSLDECRSLADAIDLVAEELKLNVFVLASSDMTHYGKEFGYLPFIDKRKENMYGYDASAIKHINNLSAKDFYDHVASHGMTICGRDAITVAIECAKLKYSRKAKLLSYYTSGDVLKNYKSAVGYAGLIFE